MTTLTKVQRAEILKVIQHRASQFPRDRLHAKLLAADRAYHLAERRGDAGTEDGNNQSDSYSRFQELDNGLVRETVESYVSYLTELYLSKSKIFSMTSHKSQQEVAAKYNLVMFDQARRTQWGSNLATFLLNCAKYNLGATEVEWISRSVYNLAFDRLNQTVGNSATVWKGNQIKNLDPYNLIFDTRVTPAEAHYCGEYIGYIEPMSQVQLYQLIATLKDDSETTVYDKAPEDNPDFSVYKLGGLNAASNLKYYEPDITPIGQEDAQLKKQDTGWAGQFGVTGGTADVRNDYEVTTFYVRLVPETVGFPTGAGIELWKFYILDGNYILASKRVSHAHGMIPVILGQMDADSLGWNTTGPAQIAIPYKKTAKQLMDRVLAGADRAIRDRAIYDSRYIKSSDINSAIPDAKIATTSQLPSNKTLDAVYKSIPFIGDTTGLADTSNLIYSSGLRAAGSNNSQAGQFTKGNRTMEEYNDVQSNAASKMFMRALQLESTAMAAIKQIIKLNIMQYQQDVTLYDPDSQTPVPIKRSDLYQADVTFAVADGLMPTEYMLSPNVLQQLMTTVTTMPQAFQEYDVAGMLVHAIEQSTGVNLQQYKLQQSQQPPAAPPQGAPQGAPNGGA